MKISKKNIKADEFIDETLETVDEAPVTELEVIEEAPTAAPCYSDCIEHIHQAIDCLAVCANETGDSKAKEAIANLSVVLLDLQSE